MPEPRLLEYIVLFLGALLYLAILCLLILGIMALVACIDRLRKPKDP